MNRTINRLKLIFLGVFAVLCVAMLVWQVGWVWPQKNCQAERKWWDNSQRVCAQPVLISDITGRVITDQKSREEALRALGRLPPAPAAEAAAEPTIR
jgi:hypothetical protein